MASTTWFGSLFFHSVVILLNPFVPNAPFFLPPENIEKLSLGANGLTYFVTTMFLFIQ